MHTTSSQAHYIGSDSEQAKRPKKDVADSILDTDEWMSREENIYKELPDLEPGMGTCSLMTTSLGTSI
uniref:Uncharacterized protein n=1 Tax=Cucumis melo TaxID=3656 RepID=A0A9I9CFR5_CUCME